MKKKEKAPSGFEPLHKGFADLSLTTWVRRHVRKHILQYHSSRRATRRVAQRRLRKQTL